MEGKADTGRKAWREVGMKIYQSWKRNEPSTVSGESITLTTIYTSFDKDEIDELEKKMPKGMLVMDDKKYEGR